MINRYTLGIIAALAFAGCGSQVAPTGMTGAASGLGQGHVYRASGSKKQLLYLGEWKWVNSNRVGQTLVLSYPSGHQVATISNYGPMCTDASGNVYIETTTTVTEYAPGGTSPIAQASLPSGASGEDCAVDATTGDIAVCGTEGVSSTSIGWVGVYPSLNKSPTQFTDGRLRYFYCGYDNAGNLFLDGFCYCDEAFSELPRGDGQFINFPGVFLYGPVQWDGQYITVENAWQGGHKEMEIWRLAISGSSYSVVGTTYLKAHGGDDAQYAWINGKTVVKPYGNSRNNDEVGYWHYPKGGSKPHRLLKGFEYVEYPLISTSYAN
jgi:hypothetical protein